MYVLFPVKKVGTSSKLTSYWRGPYKILGKLSEVLYKVNCGRGSIVQVIHCDRIRKCKKQTLRNETESLSGDDISLGNQNTHETDNDSFKDDNLPDNSENKDNENDNDNSEIYNTRRRRKPVWAKGYIFSIFRSEMAKTKTTKRKHPGPTMNSSVCKDNIPEGMTECEKKEKDSRTCKICCKEMKNVAYLRKHMKVQHGDSNAKAAECVESFDDVLDSDPEIELDYEDSIPSEDSDDGSNKVTENLELGRTIR